jgi:type II secretory pathway pseudopilin PulG
MNLFSKKKSFRNPGGFLLPELMVAIFLFSLVVTISVGSIITLLNSNKKTQSLKSVMNNLNLALDSMSKAITVGDQYDCGTAGGATNCGSGETAFRFRSNEDLNTNGSLDTIRYRRRTDTSGGYIARTIDSGPEVRMTAPEIDVTSLRFFVSGTEPSFASGDRIQPRVIILIEGTTKVVPQGTQSAFQVQTVVSQRLPDNR